MPEENKIIGLKMVKNEPQVEMSDDPGTFKPASTSLIPKIEEILFCLSSKSTWATKSKKENVIFESEKNIGSGVFKDYYDKDGDKTFHFEAAEKHEVVVNEDQGFGVDTINQSEDKLNEGKSNGHILEVGTLRDHLNTTNKEGDFVNYWGNAHEHLAVKKADVHKFDPVYEFVKRPALNRSDEISKLKDELMELFLNNIVLKKQQFTAHKIKGVNKKDFVCYMGPKESIKQSGLDGKLRVGLFKYSQKHKVKQVLESKFYLTTRELKKN